jgi:glycosyltransferase involved in cell wall biosynthesis/protein-tyrosine-phosphatase
VQVATTVAYLARGAIVRLSAVLFNEGVLARKLRQLSIPVTIIDERQYGPFARTRIMATFLRNHHVDIVHTHRYNDTVVGAAAAALAGVPGLIRTFHGLREPLPLWSRIKFSGYEMLERAALRFRADAVIAVSGHIAHELRHSRLVLPLVEIHNGLDFDNVAPRRSRELVRQELRIDADAFVIGTVGRLTPVKDQATLLYAAQAARSQHPNLAVLVVGDGPLRHKLRALAADLGIDDACVFTGSRTDVYDLIAAADVFVLSSLSEGIPMSILEAMALGVPVVATAVGGVPEIFDEQCTGHLVPAGDHEAIAAACLQLARDGISRQWMVARARRAARQRFSIDRSGQALADIYRRVATGLSHKSKLSRMCASLGAALNVAHVATSTLRRWIERARQYRRRRREGARLRALAPSARRVLIVCSGNIIRSAFASQLLACEPALRAKLSIASAGLDATPGQPAHPHALIEAAARRIDLTGHASRQVDPQDVQTADLIFVMDVRQLNELTTRFPGAQHKTFLLSALAPEVPLEIRDPVFGDRAVFRRCFDQITCALDPLRNLFTT